MTSNERTMFLAKLDRDLRGVESPYTFLIAYGASRAVYERAAKKSGPLMRRVLPAPFAGLGAYVDGRRIA